MTSLLAYTEAAVGLRIDQAESHSRLIVNQKWSEGCEASTMTIESPLERPNPWRRFWYWALLGWKWEAL